MASGPAYSLLLAAFGPASGPAYTLVLDAVPSAASGPAYDLVLDAIPSAASGPAYDVVVEALMAVDGIVGPQLSDLTIPTGKLADNVVSANAAGRAKLQAGVFDKPTVDDKFTAASVASDRLVDKVVVGFRAPFTFATASPVTFGVLNAGDEIVDSRVVITTPFDAPTASLALGQTSSPGNLLAAAFINAQAAGTYNSGDSHLVAAPDTLRLQIVPLASTAGAGYALVNVRRS